MNRDDREKENLKTENREWCTEKKEKNGKGCIYRKK